MRFMTLLDDLEWKNFFVIYSYFLRIDFSFLIRTLYLIDEGNQCKKNTYWHSTDF